jgi:hypothetical protein
MRQVDHNAVAVQASARQAAVSSRGQTVETGEAEAQRASASDLLLPSQSEQVLANRIEAAAHLLAPKEISPAPAPIVEVTIGRVEVRAVQAAQPAIKPKSVPSAPALSLEAYLSQQQGSKP